MTPNPNNTPAPELTESRLAEIDAYCGKATPGPWMAEDSETEGNYHWWHVSAGEKDITEGGSWTRKSDMNFIARARTDLPALVEEVRRLRTEVVELRKALNPFAEMHRDGCDLSEVACSRGVASDLTIITSKDFKRASDLIDAAKEPK